MVVSRAPIRLPRAYHLPSIADPYTYIAPLYPLISGAVASIARIGHSVPFPGSPQLGTRCSNALVAMFHWSSQSGAILPTIRIGYLCWIPLAYSVSYMLLLLFVGAGNCGWQYCLSATSGDYSRSPVTECLTNDFLRLQDTALPWHLILMAICLRPARSMVDGRSYSSRCWPILSRNQFALLARRTATRCLHRSTSRLRLRASVPTRTRSLSSPLPILIRHLRSRRSRPTLHWIWLSGDQGRHHPLAQFHLSGATS